MKLLSKFSLWPEANNSQNVNGDRQTKPLLGQRGYAVCTLPRSGSNFFCDILSSTGVLGNPREFFNGGARRMYDDPGYPDDRFAQVERILTTGATPNGIYALKIFPGPHDLVAPTLRWTAELPNLSFIRFKREDVVGQAISWVRSGQTQQFRSSEPVKAEPHYDGPAIADYVRKICQRNARWEMYFARTGIRPIDVTYEGLLANPTGCIRKIAAALEVEYGGEIDISNSRFKMQRNSDSDQWRDRFIQEFGNPDHIDSFLDERDSATA